MAEEMKQPLAFQTSEHVGIQGCIVNCFFALRRLAAALLPGTAAALFVFFLCANARAADVDEAAKHKARMDDAQDLKYDLADAIEAKSVDKIAEHAKAIVKLLELEDRYWKNSGLPDAIALSKENLQAAKRIALASEAGRVGTVIQAYNDLERSCAACHDAHPKKRIP